MYPWLTVAPGIRLTGHGSAWLPEHRTLVVADLHIGYDLAARRRGGFLPSVARGADLARELVTEASSLGADRLVIAGDLRHSTRDVDDAEREELAEFARVVGATLRLDVVLGNHDRGGALAGVKGVDALRVGDVDVVHHPPSTTPARWTIAGHLHPRVTLRDETGAAARFPCAMVGDRVLVLPARNTWSAGTEARRLMSSLPRCPWKVLPIDGGMVADLGLVLGEP